MSAEVEPLVTPGPGKGITEEVRGKAKKLGFGEVGFTRFDRHYAYARKKRWGRYEHAICLAMVQDSYQMQTLPSMEAEYAHSGTYEAEGSPAKELSDYIRSLGYHAQIHSPRDNSSAYIPMFVAAGLGQLGRTSGRFWGKQVQNGAYGRSRLSTIW